MAADTSRMHSVRQQIREGASLSGPHLLMNALATVVACYGLLADSTAVVIGAMVIAMLLGPITGIALGLVDGDNRLLAQSALAEVAGVATVMAIAFTIGTLHHDIPLGREIMSRTAPNILDLVIALAGGAAGAYAIASPRISVGLIGVAIATALVPPLATGSLLLARGETELASGAFLLFIANFVAIQVASSVVLWLLGFHRITTFTRKSSLRIVIPNIVSAVVLVNLAVILGVNLSRTVTKQLSEIRVRDAVRSNLAAFPDAQVVEIDSTDQDGTLHLLVTVRTTEKPSYADIVSLQGAIAGDLQRTVALKLIDVPTVKLDPLIPDTRTPTPTARPSGTPPFTPTPSPTVTPTPTATPTGTPTPTPTVTSTPTPTSTWTPTPTSTPVSAVVTNTGGTGVAMRDTPNGRIIGALPDGSPVQILYRRETVDGLERVEVRDVLSRTGWIPARFLAIAP